MLIKIGFDVLLGDGVREETRVLGLGLEGCFEGCTFRGICQGSLGSLSSGLQRILALDVLRVRCLAGVDQVHAQLLFLARTTLEIQALRFVEFAPYPGKHAM